MGNKNFDSAVDSAEVRAQQGNKPDKVPFLIMEYFETLGVEESGIKAGTRDVSADYIWGRETWNGGEWDGTYTYSVSYDLVINPSGVFHEHFVDNEFIDTGNTTATVSLGTSGSIDFTDGEILFSDKIHDQNEDITKARLNVNSSLITGTLAWHLSANGKSNWESVTVGELHSFTNIGQELYYKATASGNASIDTKYTTNGKLISVDINPS